VRVEQQFVIVKTHNTPRAILIPSADFQAYQPWRERKRDRAAWLVEPRSQMRRPPRRSITTWRKAFLDLLD
jgi:hypothetical protein